jgi:hypothetical protein
MEPAKSSNGSSNGMAGGEQVQAGHNMHE